MITIPEGLEGKSLFDFLVTNKQALIAEKKFNIKRADPVRTAGYYVSPEGDIIKGAPVVNKDEDTGVIERACVINTTNWLDSHRDVHIPGLWKKSLSENKSLYLLQEHSMTFKGIITDEVKASTKKISWKTLGVNLPGESEALIFNCTIPKSRNEFMYNEYKLGRVKNHSVGMMYVKIEMAINDKDYKEEFEVWEKYLSSIANKEEAESISYFFVVLEAKVVEGSAVPIGSNIITPVLDTQKQPLNDTVEEPTFNWSKAINETKFIKL